MLNVNLVVQMLSVHNIIVRIHFICIQIVICILMLASSCRCIHQDNLKYSTDSLCELSTVRLNTSTSRH